ncbi:MAG: GGDEF domain-containing phosphodiesterase [Lachnospiraceae bacterium]|nr:GGDEF domain-containing phosphodiesterase [Lachnospiraceae bacterium]
MVLTDEILKPLTGLLNTATKRNISNEEFSPLCRAAGVSRMYYDMDLGENKAYTDPRSGKYIMTEIQHENTIILYDNGEETDLRKKFTYYYEGADYVHAYVEFRKGIAETDIEPGVYELLSDLIYLLVSRQNMRLMLDHAEMNDTMTGIPNSIYLRKQFSQAVREHPENDYVFLFTNLQNFKFLNEQGGSRVGDEAIVKYSRKVASFIEPDEGICRLGGDNFLYFIKRQNLERMLNILSGIELSDLESARGKEFTVSAWVGVSIDRKDADFSERIEHSNTACMLGKTRLKRNVVFYSDDLAKMIEQSKRIIGMFMPALINNEFTPFFQAKVDMTTGKLVGLEALCRWYHEGSCIYPDQFIPVIDAQGIIHELDMEILRQTCIAIRKWKDMGLTPPPVSVNLSRKNIFIPGIEQKILTVIKGHNINSSDIEIEITETSKESEYDRLIEFIRKLKEFGLRISIDDFGTGYSSLSLIHNINADTIKIDKSFISSLFDKHKSTVLIESIISLAERLNMNTVAEGVETVEEGKKLIGMGCNIAQGYYYSKPSDFDFTTEIIKDPPFKPII